MPNGFANDSQSQDIGALLLQGGRWERIEESVKAGVPIRGIARALLEEDKDIKAYYEQTGSENPLKTLSNVITYHVNEKMTLAELTGYKMLGNFFAQETGDIHVLKNLKELAALQQERTGQAVLLERRLGMVTGQAGREMMILTNIYSTLGKLMVAAGMDIKEKEPETVTKEHSSPGDSYAFVMLMMILEKQGYSQKRSIEIATGVPDLAGEREPDPPGAMPLPSVIESRFYHEWITRKCTGEPREITH